MDSRQQFGRRLLVPPKKADLVNVSVALERSIAQPAVGVDHVAGLHGLFHEGNQTLGRDVWDAPRPNSPDPLAVLLGCDHNQRLAVGLSTANTLFQPTPIRLVHFNLPRESIPSWPHPSPPQVVLPRPGC